MLMLGGEAEHFQGRVVLLSHETKRITEKMRKCQAWISSMRSWLSLLKVKGEIGGLEGGDLTHQAPCGCSLQNRL